MFRTLSLLALTTSVAHALPDKQTQRSEWIAASMEGKQAAFCGVPQKSIGGPADPDFTVTQITNHYNDDISKATLDDVMQVADALCKFPGNPDLQKALLPKWQAFTKRYKLESAQDAADFAAAMDRKRKQVEEDKPGKESRFADLDPRAQAVFAKGYVETAYGMDFMSYAELLDSLPQFSEHLKASFVAHCVDSYHGSLGRWAICKADALSLDRSKIDKELAGKLVDPRVRLEAKIKFVQLQDAVAAFAAKVNGEAKRDSGVAKVIDELPKEAAKKWTEETAAYTALLGWTSTIADNARAQNKKLMEGCEDELLKHVGVYLSQTKPQTPEDLKAAFKDNIGSQLGEAATACFVRNKDVQTFWASWSHGFAHYVGPRTATWHAIASTKIEFDTNRGNDPIGLPRPVILFSNSSHGGSSGTIATATKTADGVDITFKKESWKEPVCKAWKETNRVDGIDMKSGKLIYRSVCTSRGYETRTSKAEPVKVPAKYAAGLKPGIAATFVRADDGTGYPTAVFADAKRSKLVGAFGVMY